MREDRYREAERLLDMTYLGSRDDYPPMRESAQWRCNRCGAVKKASFKTLFYRRPPCGCRLGKHRLNAAAFRRRAAELSLEWVEEPFCPRSTDATRWRSPLSGETFEASYHDLRWPIKRRFRRHIPETLWRK